MAATLNMVFGYLTRKSTLELPDLSPIPYSGDIRNATAYCGENGHTEPYLIYVCEGRPKKPNGKALPQHLVYVHNGQAFYKTNEGDLLIWEEGATVNNALFAIRNALLHFAQVQERFFSILSESSSIQDLTDLLAEELQNPVMVFFRGMRLAAQSKVVRSSSFTWEETAEKGYLIVRESGVEDLKRLSAVSHNSPLAAIYEPQNKQLSRLMTRNITADNKNIGVMHVIEEKNTFAPADLDIANIAAACIALAMLKTQAVNMENSSPYETLFMDLLRDSVRTEEALHARQFGLGLRFSRYCFIALVRTRGRFAIDETLRQVRDRIRLIFPVSICMVYEKGIVMLINHDSREACTAYELERLLSVLELYDMHCGISRGSDSMLDIHRLYQQAQQAIKLGAMSNGSQRIHLYDDIVMMDFFDTCVQGTELDVYLHPAIRLLQKHDEQHNSNLLETLRCFIGNSGNQVETARAMHVHRSTLLYRLHKVEEVGEISLDNNETRFVIQLSFKLMEYQSLFSSRAKK